MLRNVMFAPWFAVGAGVMIAASVTLATPHPALSFPPSAGGYCAGPGCRPRGTGQPQPAMRHEVRPHVPGKRGNRAQPSSTGVEYEILHRGHDQFLAVIVLISAKLIGRWRLRLVLPGARIRSVMWARWEPEGADAVLVRGTPLPWPGSETNEARIVILGTGRPGPPTGCVIDGVRCTFRALARGPARSGPGPA